MEFTQEEFKALCDVSINEEKIIITGCTSFSQEFEVIGKIAKITTGELFEDDIKPNRPALGITNDTLIIDLGKKKENEMHSPYCASFVTDLYEDDFYNFVIKEIKLNRTKKTLYYNEDYQATFDYCRETLAQYGKRLMKENITPGTMHPTCQKLTNHVGKPVNIMGERGVLFLADSYYKGEIMLYVLDFKTLKEYKVPSTIKIEEGKTLLKLTELKNKTTFEDYIFNLRKK